MLSMSPKADERAKGVDLPAWWLERVRELVDERKETLGEGLTELGKSLARAVDREEAWDHSSVSRFLRNRNTTVPMAEAFSELLGVPRPFFVPRSLEEAIALTATSKRYEGRTTTTPEQQRRLAQVDSLLEQEKRAANDATDDDRAHGKGERGGRSGKRRPARS